MRTKLKSKHLIVTLTRGIALSHDTNNATCHTRVLTHGNNFFCKKN